MKIIKFLKALLGLNKKAEEVLAPETAVTIPAKKKKKKYYPKKKKAAAQDNQGNF